MHYIYIYFAKKLEVVYEWKLQWLTTAKNYMYGYIYTKRENNCARFLYKSQTLFKKQDNFRYVFIYKKQDTLRDAIFHENFEVSIYVQKAWHFVLTLRDKNRDTLQKARQFAWRFGIVQWMQQLFSGCETRIRYFINDWVWHNQHPEISKDIRWRVFSSAFTQFKDVIIAAIWSRVLGS